MEQILPTKDTKSFAISMASKAQEEVQTQEKLRNSHVVRLAFWEQFLTENNKVNKLFSNISTSKDSWIGKGIGMTGVNLNLVATQRYCQSEIYFNRGSKEENKKLFDFAYKMKETIETKFGGVLEWERMNTKVSCRIKSTLTGVSIFDKDDWPKMIQFLIDVAARMETVFR